MIEYKKMIMVEKVLKITLCIMLVFIFTIMKPKQEAEAAVPILGWVAGVIGGLVIDVALDQGVTFANKQAEKDFKNTVVTKIWNSYSTEIVKLKPTKLSALKWALKAPKWLMVVVADAVSDTIEHFKKSGNEKEKYMSEWGGGGSAGAGAGRKFGPSESKPIDEFIDLPVHDPYYKTDLVIKVFVPDQNNMPSYVEAYNYFVKYAKITVVPVPYGQKNNVSICIGDTCFTDNPEKKYMHLVFEPDYTFSYANNDTSVFPALNTMFNVRNVKMTGMVSAWTAYKQYLAEKGTRIIEFDNVLLLDTPRLTIDLPDFVEPEKLELIPLPNKNYEDKIIEFDLPDEIKPQLDLIPVGADFEWELIDNYIVEQGDNFYKIDYRIDYKPVINNYYSLPPAVIEGIEKDYIYPVEKDKGEVGELDGSIFLYIKNFYNYFAEGITTSIDGFKQLNSSVNSIFSVFGNYFTFLPIEFRTLFFSGASMSVLLGVLYWGRK